MVSFGAVLLDDDFELSFYGQTRPLEGAKWDPEALAISGHSREEHLAFDDPAEVMANFAEWIKQVNGKGRPIFWSDNNGFDFAYINYYFHLTLGRNPFGWSSRNINDLYKGLTVDMYSSFKHLRKTKHTHHPVDDATGNAEALLQMREIHNFNITKG